METYHDGVTYILAIAKASLGNLYALGLGVSTDDVQALKWISLAVASLPPGNQRDDFAARRDYLAARMTPDQTAEAQRMAREWLEQHRTGGDQ
jgi:TPR repeat protein